MCLCPPPTVLIPEPLSEGPAAWLGERCELKWIKQDEAGFDDALARADALVIHSYTRVNRVLLDRAPRLKVVGRCGVGLDHIDVAACRERGIEVVHTPAANTQAVVEYTIGLMLDALRPRPWLQPSDGDEQFHLLRKTQVGGQLDQLSLGILGFGRIGKRLAAVAHAIGMNLYVCDLLAEAELRKAAEIPFEVVNQSTLLGQSDVVSIHVDARPENQHLIDRPALAALSADAVLINAARGMVIDHKALADWAKSNPNAQAMLDVHDPEPPPADSPLRQLPNVRLLPHIAARTDQAMENMNWVVRDVAAVLAGEKPHHPAP